VPHDVVNVGFRVRHNDAKANKPQILLYATDLGQVTAKVREMAEGVDVLIIESNYDTHYLWARTPGTYKPELKDRIDSDKGHLSNHQVAELLQYLNSNKRSKSLKMIVAAHVGNKSNRADVLLRTFMEGWARGDDRLNLPPIELFSRRMSSRIYTIGENGIDFIESRYNK
jgi:phosphoribosyl 1,2-cyclic phosphodiesterase